MMKLHGMILFNILQSLHFSPFVATCTCFKTMVLFNIMRTKPKPLLGCIGVKLRLFFGEEVG